MDILTLATIVSKELGDLADGSAEYVALDLGDADELERAVNFAAAFIDAERYPFELMRHPFRPSFVIWRTGEPCPIYPEVRT